MTIPPNGDGYTRNEEVAMLRAEIDNLRGEPVGRALLARCYRLRHCGFAPNCVCDVDPTDTKDVAEWEKEIATPPQTERPLCPRCKSKPVDSALLGRDGEGHICGECWTADRHNETDIGVLTNGAKP